MYLNHKETQTQTPLNLLAALWRQLVLGKAISTESPVQQLYQRHSEKGTRPTLAEVHGVLSAEVDQWSKTYIVVDALDEYPEDERMILLEWLTTMGPTVNLMITSRPHITLPSFSNFVVIEIHASDEDIRKYVNQRIQAHSRLLQHVQKSPGLREHIITRIVGTVDGMFLLAKLHMESLAPKTTPNSVREALEHLPRTLSAAYKVTMDRINQQEMDSRDLAHAALTWVTNAQRVLTVMELQEALAVRVGAKKVDPDDRPEASIILNVCAGLIIIDQTSSTVRLVHYSTQNYLEGCFPEAQTDITRTLLTYLAFDDLQLWLLDKTVFMDARIDEEEQWVIQGKQRQDMEQKHPLVDYCGYCLVHAVGQPEVELRDMILNFLEAAAQWHRRMYQWHAPPWDFRHWPSSPSPLWVAAAADLLKIVEYLLGHGEVPNNKDKGISALCVASFKGHIQMVKLLRGASPSWEAGCNCRALRLASESGHTDVVQFLLESGTDVNAATGLPLATALCDASSQGHMEIVRLLLKYGADVNAATGQFLATALCGASSQGHMEIVRLLLEKGADVNAATERFGTALYTASSQGHMEIVQLLLKYGADVNAWPSVLEIAAKNGNTELVRLLLENGATKLTWALESASAQGHLDIVHLLLENGTDVNALSGIALRDAIRYRHPEIVHLLLTNGADVSLVRIFSSDSGMHGPYGALQAATAIGAIDIFHLLLDNGADVNADLYKTGTALQVATKKGNTEIISLLLEYGADVNAGGSKHGHRPSALEIAAGKGDMELVRLLLEYGADVNAGGSKHGDRPSALEIAAGKGDMELVRLLLENGAEAKSAFIFAGGHIGVTRLLLENGANVNVDSFWGNPLQCAADAGNMELVRFLLENGAEVNLEAGDFGTALQSASYSGQLEAVGFLLENGAEVNSEAGFCGTALKLASAWGHIEVVRLLLESGANINVVDEVDGQSALQAASKGGYTKIVCLLLQNGADINLAAGEYGSALCLALENGHMEIIRLLLESGADANIAARKYGTPLYLASRKGCTDIVRALLDSGADVNGEGGKDGSALQIALKYLHEDIIELLVERGAEIAILVAAGGYGTALYYASARGFTQMVHLLLHNGADINEVGEFFRYALAAASTRGHIEIVHLLVGKAVDINSVAGSSDAFLTALRLASEDSHIKAVLLEKWPKTTGKVSQRALRLASQEGHMEIVDLLCEKGAEKSNDRVDNSARAHAAEEEDSLKPEEKIS